METKILRVVETSDVSDQGRAVPSLRIEFNIGSHGPFTVVLPKKDFTAQAANQKINEFKSHLTQLQGLG